MHRNRRLIVNTALMTGSSIVMRCIGLVFQAWIVGRIGAAGIGLYQLVMSVSVLFATFAISGIRFATTRLISEEMVLERGAGVGIQAHEAQVGVVQVRKAFLHHGLKQVVVEKAQFVGLPEELVPCLAGVVVAFGHAGVVVVEGDENLRCDGAGLGRHGASLSLGRCTFFCLLSYPNAPSVGARMPSSHRFITCGTALAGR